MDVNVGITFADSAFKHGVTIQDICHAATNYCHYWRILMAEYKDLTDEEYAALDAYYTEHIPRTVRGKPGVFARQKTAHMFNVDDLSADFIITKALAEHATPAQIIGRLVRQHIAAQANSDA
jgi:hypothetical protein